ncbi:hypothetical protein [Kribbella sp. NPDC004875]|uniref:hypothetical protein n=1 Tax=Kribbella sp. NPDC004875 TaxID=3364107 RepID=UPI0036844B34
MSWQLWVLIALAAAGVLLLAVARMRHARKVFDDITDLEHTPASTPADSPADELARARARARAAHPEPGRHRRHG